MAITTIRIRCHVFSGHRLQAEVASDQQHQENNKRERQEAPAYKITIAHDTYISFRPSIFLGHLNQVQNQSSVYLFPGGERGRRIRIGSLPLPRASAFLTTARFPWDGQSFLLYLGLRSLSGFSPLAPAIISIRLVSLAVNPDPANSIGCLLELVVYGETDDMVVV